jgi:hypothetical protein
MFNPWLACSHPNRLIVEQKTEEMWRASFAGLPEFGVTATHPFSAIQNLIDRSGDPSLSLSELRPVVEATRCNRLEFEIRRADWRPKVLAN